MFLCTECYNNAVNPSGSKSGTVHDGATRKAFMDIIRKPLLAFWRWTVPFFAVRSVSARVYLSRVSQYHTEARNDNVTTYCCFPWIHLDHMWSRNPPKDSRSSRVLRVSVDLWWILFPICKQIQRGTTVKQESIESENNWKFMQCFLGIEKIKYRIFTLKAKLTSKWNYTRILKGKG
jgi:hypothetical protein